MVGPHQACHAGKMIVLAMGVENAFDLVHTDTECGQRIGDIRAGIDQVYLTLKDDHTRHARAIDFPAVALARMDHREIIAVDAFESEWVGGPIVAAADDR